jgi:hypothetical protein
LFFTADDGIHGRELWKVELPEPPPAAATTLLAVGANRGLPRVRVFDAQTGGLKFSFLAYSSRFKGGVRVAVGDVNGDSVPDIITGPGLGMAARVKVFNGANGQLLRSFLAFPSNYGGGVFVAAGDINCDGFDDIVVGRGAGGAQVKVFSGKNNQLLRSFPAFGPGFLGGVRVAAGDVNGDGRDDLIAGAGPGSTARVRVFNAQGGGLMRDFLAFGPAWTGGIFVAAGDVNRDGRADIVVGADWGGSPMLRVFNGRTLALLCSYHAFPAGFRGGVRVAAADLNRDGKADVLAGAGPGGAPVATVFRGLGPDVLRSFLAFDSSFRGGVFVAAG